MNAWKKIVWHDMSCQDNEPYECMFLKREHGYLGKKFDKQPSSMKSLKHF